MSALHKPIKITLGLEGIRLRRRKKEASVCVTTRVSEERDLGRKKTSSQKKLREESLSLGGRVWRQENEKALGGKGRRDWVHPT